MATLGKQLMDFINDKSIARSGLGVDIYWDDDAEHNINEFLAQKHQERFMECLKKMQEQEERGRAEEMWWRKFGGNMYPPGEAPDAEPDA